MKCEKSGNHTISYQSLLLSTTVLNDIVGKVGGGELWQIVCDSLTYNYCQWLNHPFAKHFPAKLSGYVV